MRNVVIAGACRTPIGTMGGALSSKSAVELGALVISEALKRAKVRDDLKPVKEQLAQQIAKTIEDVSESSNYKMNQVNTGVDKRSKKILAIVSDILSEKLAKPLVDDIIEEIVTVLNGKKD